MSFYRTPSPLEFSYIATDTPEKSPLVNQFFVTGEGSIDPQKLQGALNEAAQINPAFRFRLRGFWGWRYWDDEGPSPLVKEVNAPDWDSSSSYQAPCLGDPINPRKDPVCLVCIIHAKNGYHVLFRTHHAVSDGRGTVHFIQDVFRILRGEQPIGSHSKITEWDVAQSNERPARPITEGDCIPLVKGSLDPDRLGYQWIRFSWQGSTNKFAAKLLSATSSLGREMYGDGKVIVRIPADLRRYIEPDETFTTANCSGAIDLEIEPDLPVNKLQSKIIRAMRNKEDLSPFLDNHKYARWVPRAMMLQHPKNLRQNHVDQRYRMSGIISYLGEVDNSLFQCEGFKPTSQFGIPIPFENRSLFVGAAENDGSVDIIVGCPKALLTEAEIKSYSEKLAERLNSF